MPPAIWQKLSKKRKRELAEKKAREEEELMRKYAEEEAASEKAKASMADRIAARKRELAEKKAQEEEAQMKAYASQNMTAEEKQKALEAKVEEMKRQFADEKAKQEQELKGKMLEMKKAGKSADEIKAFLLAEKKKMAEAVLQGKGSSSGATTSSSDGPTYTLEQLKKRPAECDGTKLESYLSDVDFKKYFGVVRSEFEKYPAWKKTDAKKKLQLY